MGRSTLTTGVRAGCAELGCTGTSLDLQRRSLRFHVVLPIINSPQIWLVDGVLGVHDDFSLLGGARLGSTGLTSVCRSPARK